MSRTLELEDPDRLLLLKLVTQAWDRDDEERMGTVPGSTSEREITRRQWQLEELERRLR